MLPSNLLSYELRDGGIAPRYLAGRDEGWVQILIDELDALVGRTQGEAHRILAEKLPGLAASAGVPLAALRGVLRILQRSWRGKIKSAVPPSTIRRVVFDLGADPRTPRDEVLRRAAAALGLPVEQVSEGMFADRPSERRLAAPGEEPSPREIVHDYNIALVQGFLLRAEEAVARAGEHALRVLRSAKRHRLLYCLRREKPGPAVGLAGPLSLLRQTGKYGRALANFFPWLVAAPGWSLEAHCRLGRRRVRLFTDASDPLGAVRPAVPAEAESAFERRLVADVRQLGSAWSIARETAALEIGTGTFVPDFTLARGSERVYVEIAGFHTAEYLAAKLEETRQARLRNVIVCVDDALACSDGRVEAEEIFHFRGAIDAARLLQVAERRVSA